MKNQNFNLDFIALPVSEKIVECEVISNNFKNQKDAYPSPDLGIDVFDSDIVAFSDAYKKSLNHGDSERAILAKWEIKIDDDYRTLALYANRVTNGDEQKLIDLGFRVKRGLVSKPHHVLQVVAGNHSGSVVVKFHTVPGAKTYIYQISTDGTNWSQYGIFTTCKITIINLTVDTRYYFRVAAVTAKETSDFSIVVSKMVE